MIVIILIFILNLATIETLLVGMPESVGVLVFGIALVTTAVLIRRLLDQSDIANTGENSGKKVW